MLDIEGHLLEDSPVLHAYLRLHAYSTSQLICYTVVLAHGRVEHAHHAMYIRKCNWFSHQDISDCVEDALITEYWTY